MTLNQQKDFDPMFLKNLVFTLISLVGLASSLSAQNRPAFAAKATPLTPAGQQFVQPVWSPDGTLIAMAGKNYRGIWLMNADGSGLRQLTDAIASGYRFSWSSDSKELVTRQFEYRKRRRLNTIHVYDIVTGDSRRVATSPSTIAGLPRWSANNSSIIYLTHKGLQKVSSGRTGEKPGSRMTFYNEQSSLLFLDTRLSVAARLTPTGGTYLNAALSPDGQKIAFELLGGNLYVVNADGTDLTDLGPGERPSWSPDSDWLTYMITEDDGHRFLGSDILIIRPDGTGKRNLTNTGLLLEMNPNWSPDGRQIVFDERRSGRIYSLEVK